MKKIYRLMPDLRITVSQQGGKLKPVRKEEKPAKKNDLPKLPDVGDYIPDRLELTDPDHYTVQKY